MGKLTKQFSEESGESTDAKCTHMRDEFRKWRNKFSIQHAKDLCKKVRASFSCAVFSSGGLLDTIAAIRCGFTPKYGAEIDEKMQRMWEDVL